jgi:subtilisin family serine protease
MTISRFFSILKLAFLFCLVIIAETKATDAGEGEYFIQFKPDVINSEDFTPDGATIIEKFPTINAQIWELDERITAESLDNDTNLDAVSECRGPNYTITSTEIPTEYVPGSSSFWGLKQIHAQKAWEYYQEKVKKGNLIKKYITIAVIDSGVDYTHIDLIENMWINPGEIADNGIDDDGNGYIDDVYGYNFFDNTPQPSEENGTHGTHVAGIIAAANNGSGIVGVNWISTKIMALKVMSTNSSGYVQGKISHAYHAIKYATQMEAKIINLSWGMYNHSHPCLEQALEYARRAGVLIITSAGHNRKNTDEERHYPSGHELDNIISVTATNDEDELADFKAKGGSNYGINSVDIGAPGVDINSTVPSNDYKSQGGTSMATPYVTGVASLVWSLYPDLNYLQVKEMILSSVDKFPDSLEGKILTGGRLNAYGAVTAEPPGVNICNTREFIGTEPLTVYFKGPDSIEQCESEIEGTEIGGEVLGADECEEINYTWQICLDTNGCLEPDTKTQKSFSYTFEKKGTYPITLKIKHENCQKEITRKMNVEVLPNLGKGVGFDRNGQFVTTTAKFGGGSSINGGEYRIKQYEQNTYDHVKVLGEIIVDSKHVGQSAEILVVVLAKFPKDITLWLILGSENEPPLLWDGNLSTLTAFQSNVTLNASEPVSMWSAKLPPGLFQFFFGYRLTNESDTIIADINTPIEIKVSQ